jgi:cytochrome b
MNTDKQIKVWDLLVRIFHWSLAFCFLLAYITEDHFMSLHALAGYVIGGLIVFRLIWGFIGTRHARFSDFYYPPATIIAYLKSVISFKAEHYIGHNPAGGAMVFALLISLALTVLTGFAAYGAEQASGPMAGVMASMPHAVGKAVEEVHEFFANFTLLLVILHVVGVLLASFQHSENLVRSMLTGRKQSPLADERK